MKRILLSLIAFAGVWMTAGAVDWVTESEPTSQNGRYIYEVNTGKFVMAGKDKNNVLAYCESSSSVPSLWKIGDNNSLKSGDYFLTTGLTGDECTTNNKSSQSTLSGRYGRNMTFDANTTNGTKVSYKIYRNAAGNYYLYGSGNKYLSGTSHKNDSKNMFISETQWTNHWIVDAYEKAVTYYNQKDKSKISEASKAWAEKYIVPNLKNASTYQQNITSADLNKDNVVTNLTKLIVAWNENPENYAYFYETKNYADYNFSKQDMADVVVEHTFWGNEWNTLCVPFNISVDDLKGYLGNDVEVAELTGFSDKTLKFSKVEATLKAGQPYLVWPYDGTNPAYKKVDIRKQGVNLAPANSTNINNGEAIFQGTYSYIDNLDDGKKDIYIINGNTLYCVNSKVSTKAFRGYFIIPDGLDGGALSASFDDDATGITSVNENEYENENLYNIAGQRVGENAKGIIIKNGKKYLVK